MSVEQRILIVDDDDDARGDAEHTLQPLGTVDCASNSADAHKLLQQHLYAVAVLDMTMKDVDGEMSDDSGAHLATFINDRFPQTRVIVLTHSTSINRAVEMARQGVRYLSKYETTSGALRSVAADELEASRQASERLARMTYPPS